MKNMFAGFRILIVMTFITGVIYPGFVTIAGQCFFNKKVNGSVVIYNNREAGSELIGQSFTEDKYFHPRFSAGGYNGLSSGGTNKSITDKEYVEMLEKAYRTNQERYNSSQIAQDSYTYSASGLDPHITPENAMMQVESVAKARNLTPVQKEKLYGIIRENIEKKDFGLFGEERINVLKINMAIDKML